MGHTPGPWEVAIPGEVDEHYAVLDGFGHTASVYGHPEETSTALANARLIAAAPELLDALKDVRSELDTFEVEDPLSDLAGRVCWCAKRLDAAIAKAEGRGE